MTAMTELPSRHRDMTDVGISTKPFGEFRSCLPDLNQPRFTTAREQDAQEYVDAFLTGQHPPWLYNLYMHWRDLYQEPYKGVTNDGGLRDTRTLLQNLISNRCCEGGLVYATR
jgi:hypothetical protein